MPKLTSKTEIRPGVVCTETAKALLGPRYGVTGYTQQVFTFFERQLGHDAGGVLRRDCQR